MGGSAAPLSAVAYAPFENAKAMATGFAFERINVNYTAQVITETVACHAVDLTTSTVWTEQVGMAPWGPACFSMSVDRRRARCFVRRLRSLT